MKTLLMDCPYCRYIVAGDKKKCPLCEQSLVVANLKCVKPVANIPSGQIWELYPRDYTIGRHPSNDIIITEQYISRHHINLIYKNFGFKIENLSKNKLPEEDTVRLLSSGETFSIAEGVFSIRYICNFSKYAIVNAEIFPILMSFQAQMANVETVQDVFNLVIDNLLRITHFEKGYLFKIIKDGEKHKLQPQAARIYGFSDLETSEIPVSQTFLKKVFDAPERIIVRSATDISKSIISLQLESIVCIPIVNTDKEVEFILYADTREKVPEQNLMFMKPLLQVMRKMIIPYLPFR